MRPRFKFRYIYYKDNITNTRKFRKYIKKNIKEILLNIINKRLLILTFKVILIVVYLKKNRLAGVNLIYTVFF